MLPYQYPQATSYYTVTYAISHPITGLKVKTAFHKTFFSHATECLLTKLTLYSCMRLTGMGFACAKNSEMMTFSSDMRKFSLKIAGIIWKW